MPLTSGSHRGSHVEPDAPRAIEEWDGAQWVIVGSLMTWLPRRGCCTLLSRSRRRLSGIAR
ncbi:DUF6087 family protein [Streptomyces sp. NPDC006475]|uniref:DUF6087 family protein n=1 Tax=Streptomyces sp. NPDC006475 TaxID=3155719 RepID=UPI0033BBD354